MSQYWLLEWMDREDIRTIHDAHRALATKPGVERLHEAAAVALRSPMALEPARGQIVAGSGLDLSGLLSCTAGPCLINRVDSLLRHVWHYFDTVLVTGLDPMLCIEILRNASETIAVYALYGHIEVALYIRSIGAEDLLYFSRYPALCAEHLDQHAREAGMPPVSRMSKSLRRELLADYSLTKDASDDERMWVTFKSPLMDVSSVARFPKADWPGDAKVAKHMARHDADMVSGLLVRNVALAKMAGAALGQVTALRDARAADLTKPTASAVAFSMPLPTLESVPIPELMAFRRDAASDYVVFRAALREAVNEQMKAMPEGTAQDVADAVLDDVVRPALARIEKRTSGAAALLGKRSGLSVAVSATLATVGFLAFAPLVVPGIVVGAGGLLATVNDYFKDQKELRESDMYFLWQLHNLAVRQ